MKRIKRNQFRRGTVLIYSFYMMIIMMVMVSLAVDFGRCQLIKTEMQRTADATAHAALEQYILSPTGTTTASSTLKTEFANNSANSLSNPVDYASGVTPTFKVNYGTWNTTTKTFTASNSAFLNPPTGSQAAVKVLVSRSAQNSNAVPLTFPLVSGSRWVRTTVDIWATSIAMLNPPQTVTETISGQYNPWLSGMPAGSTLSYGTSTPTNNLTDTEATDGPPLTMNVTAGSFITITNVSGAVNHDPTLGTDGPDGNQSWTHMQDSPDGNHVGEQNNIQTLTAPLDSLVGVFLAGANTDAPSAANAPATANDYLTQNDNQIQLQQPFYVGDGTPVSGGSTAAQFLVPAGATRLYLGTMDGFQWINNGGTFTATITQQPTISLVQ